MRKKLACLHAHFSNIQYIEQSLSSYDIELIHFVDPGLIHRVNHDRHFQPENAQKKVKEQIEWMANCGVDAILITCTNYIALLPEDDLLASVPILKIDEPYFEYISSIRQPQTIIFSNAATVKGTMERLNQYATRKQRSLNVDVMIIPDVFELIMKGLQQEYTQAVSTFLINTSKDKENLSVAQLSMVEAAQQVEEATLITIINPLNLLITTIIEQLELKRKA
ncbi:hypothetical protein [Bacillus sp. JJ722]|uniref:hypothetical protein n=1 Tax=Bacillus sp. JJ722 TaxID=3122973 RepID=UPI00300028BA